MWGTRVRYGDIWQDMTVAQLRNYLKLNGYPFSTAGLRKRELIDLIKKHRAIKRSQVLQPY